MRICRTSCYAIEQKIDTNINDDLGADFTAAPVNLLLSVPSRGGHADKLLQNTYPYKSMLETLLNYCEDATKSQLSAE